MTTVLLALLAVIMTVTAADLAQDIHSAVPMYLPIVGWLAVLCSLLTTRGR